MRPKKTLTQITRVLKPITNSSKKKIKGGIIVTETDVI